MSGPYCPDCGSVMVRLTPKQYICTLCLHVGGATFKTYSPDVIKKRKGRELGLRDKKAKGQLSFVRIFVNHSNEVMQELTAMVGSADPGTMFDTPYYIVRWDGKPTSRDIDNMRKVKGVQSVTVI